MAGKPNASVKARRKKRKKKSGEETIVNKLVQAENESKADRRIRFNFRRTMRAAILNFLITILLLAMPFVAKKYPSADLMGFTSVLLVVEFVVSIFILFSYYVIAQNHELKMLGLAVKLQLAFFIATPILISFTGVLGTLFMTYITVGIIMLSGIVDIAFGREIRKTRYGRLSRILGKGYIAVGAAYASFILIPFAVVFTLCIFFLEILFFRKVSEMEKY